ncbi:MAG: hypothetical protein ACHQRO_09230 [Vicinamibacteria bacterium]
MRVTCLLVGAMVIGCAAPSAGQVTSSADVQPPAVTPAEDRTVTPNEDVEPRVVGVAGRTAIGLAGYADRITSEDDNLPFHLTLQVDVSHFLTRRIAVRGGVVGSGALGGDADDVPAGIGVTALHAFGAASYYFTPGSMASFYAGAGYWAQITARDGPDSGSILGLGGMEAALSSRATVFVEGGYGLGLTKSADGATRQRFVARVGVRVKL